MSRPDLPHSKESILMSDFIFFTTTKQWFSSFRNTSSRIIRKNLTIFFLFSKRKSIPKLTDHVPNEQYV